MFTEGMDTETRSCWSRLRRRLPSMPSIGFSSKDFYKKIFRPALNPQYSTQLSEKNSADLNSLTLPEGLPDETPARERSRYTMYAVMAVTSMISYGLFRFVQSQISQVSNSQPVSNGSDLAMASSVMAFASRKILQASNVSVFTIAGREEVPLEPHFIPDSIEEGRRIVFSKLPLPQGVRLVAYPMSVLDTISVSYFAKKAIKGNTVYLADTQKTTLEVTTVDSFANQFPQYVLNVGAPVSELLVSGDSLAITGPGHFQILNTSVPLRPVIQDGYVNASISGNAIATPKTDKPNNQFGWATNQGFKYVNGNNCSIEGTIPGVIGYKVAASETHYFIVTQTGIVSANVMPSSNYTGFFPHPNLNKGNAIYIDNHLIVTNFTQVLVFDVQEPAQMKLVYISPVIYPAIIKAVGSLLYWLSAVNVGLGIANIKNITNIIFSISGLLPQIGIGGLSSIDPLEGDRVMVQPFDTAYIVRGQDGYGFEGTPAAGERGNHPGQLGYVLLTGEESNQTKDFDFSIAGAIIAGTIAKIIVGAGKVFSWTLPARTFTHVNGFNLAYNLACPPGPIDDAFSLNPNGEFNGNPPAEGVGSATCTVRAEDDFAASATSSVDISVVSGPILRPVPTQIAIIGESYTLNLVTTSEDVLNTDFTYAISNLPSSLTLVNGVITGTPTENDTDRFISVTVTDANGISDTQSFRLQFIKAAPPIYVNAPSDATIYLQKSFTIYTGGAISLSNPRPNITFTATLADGSPLPEWMNFDGIALRGIPPYLEKLYWDITYPILITAIDMLASGKKLTVSTKFKIVLAGDGLITTGQFIGGAITGTALSLGSKNTNT